MSKVKFEISSHENNEWNQGEHARPTKHALWFSSLPFLFPVFSFYSLKLSLPYFPPMYNCIYPLFFFRPFPLFPSIPFNFLPFLFIPHPAPYSLFFSPPSFLLPSSLNSAISKGQKKQHFQARDSQIQWTISIYFYHGNKTSRLGMWEKDVLR